MSYLNQAYDPRRRAAAVTGTLAINAALGIAVVTGLTIAGYQTVDKYEPPIFHVPIDQPPDPKPTPVPPSQANDRLIVTPLPPIDLHTIDPTIDTVADPVVDDGNALVVDTGHSVEPALDPRPLATFTPRRARPSNDPLRWITTEDYPARALRAEAQGIASYRVIVATNGRASACDVTRSTGNGQLDDATCDFILRRARFEAATDANGAKVVGSYTGNVKWEIPD